MFSQRLLEKSELLTERAELEFGAPLEAHGYRQIVAARLREKVAALCQDAAAGRLEALNAKGVEAISPALTRRRSGYAGKPRIAKPTLKELQHGRAAMMQPFQGWPVSTRRPRVATSSQPWAG